MPDKDKRLEEHRKRTMEKAWNDPDYRPPQYDRLSDLVAGRMQAGPQSTPPRAGDELDYWQHSDLFHSPEL